MLARRERRLIGRAVTVSLRVVFACALLSMAVVRADDDIVVETEFAGDQPRAQPFNAQQAASHVASLVQNYEHQVFQHQVFQLSFRSRLTPPQRGNDRPSARVRMERCTEEWLRRIDASCGLTAQQKTRLQEALRDDVETVMTQIEADLAKYKAVRFEGRDAQFQRDTFQVMSEDACRVRDMIARTFDADSVLFKVLPTTLTAEQYDRLNADFAARRAGRWAAAVASALDKLDQALGLTTRQHDGLEQALLARQPALRVYPPAAESLAAWHMLVSIELADMDEDVLKAIVNERQWDFLAGLRRSGQTMRPHYVKQGWYEP